jgi:hypothetical protein
MARLPLPSEVVSALQLDGQPMDGVYDAIVKLWLPTHRDCHALYTTQNGRRFPQEIVDAAVCCVDQQYDPDSENGRIPGHSEQF